MDLGLFQHIDRNRRRSVFLIVGAVVFLGIVGGVFGAAFVETLWGGVAVAVVVGMILALIAWNQGGSIVLAAAGAQEMRREDDLELVNVVEEMAIASGLPRPRIYLIPSASMNAFATGISPDKAVVAITAGLRERLNREELQGVVAHEMAHIGNYDTRVMVLMAVIVGSIAILAGMARRGLLYGRGGRGRGKAGTALMIVAVLLAILAPLVAVIIQLAVSRQREYLADATAASMTRNPGALADALEKLSSSRAPLETANRGTQHLFIVNPFRQTQQANSAFATHPPIADRIYRLRRLAGQGHAAARA